jgi:hypothetical protein
MANVIEVLRVLLVDEGERARFGTGPTDYLVGQGLDDLAGEDIVEALPLVCDRLPDDVARSVRDRLGDRPPVSPGPEESELEAAVRQIEFATALVMPGEEHHDG